MKLGITFALLIPLAVSLTACGGQDTPSPAGTPAVPPTDVPTPPTSGTPARDPEALAQQMVAWMAAGDFTSPWQRFDAIMKQLVPAEQLAAIWKATTDQYGAFERQAGAQSGQAAGYQVVLVRCVFAKGTLGILFAFNSNGQVGGLHLVPDTGATPAASYTPPAYAQPDTFQERDVQVGSGEWVLPGTLSLPRGAGPFPAVVLVHGSGPNDRDETIGPNKPFRDLAWGLASQGIAVLRYDKRTKVYGARFAALKNYTVKEETTDDALAAVDLLRHTPGIDARRIFVLGHSLGATLAPRIGAADPQIAGLIILAGLTQPLEDTILEQYTYIFSLDGSISADEQQQIDSLKAQVARVKDPNLSLNTPADQLPLNVAPSYWLDLRNYHPAEVARGLAQPLLILQGERDYQVTMANFQGWKDALAGRADVQFHSYPALDHLFIAGQGKITPEEYNHPGHVDAQVVRDIGAWVKAH